ncbi:MAG: SH3 domain-containing protein [Alphaproteobacteria bacterium]|nr:MAG: SH3 domain-containing protein [Alphaproteobacteria bacterium]
MLSPQLSSWSRYLGSIAGSVGVVALSVMFLLEAPAASTAKSAAVIGSTVAPLKRAVGPKPLPQLPANAFDISRTVKVDIVGKVEPRTLPSPAADAAGSSTSAAVAIVTADAVNLRSNASKSGARLGVVRQGARVTVLEVDRGWTRVATEDNTTGWMASKFLGQ